MRCPIARAKHNAVALSDEVLYRVTKVWKGSVETGGSFLDLREAEFDVHEVGGNIGRD
jgi:hypothetical protein